MHKILNLIHFVSHTTNQVAVILQLLIAIHCCWRSIEISMELFRSNETGNTTTADPDNSFPKWEFLSIICCLSFIGIVGNAAVCFVIYRTKAMHNATNYLIVNLAVADLFVCVFTVMQLLIYVFDLWPSSVIGKKLFCYFFFNELFLWIATIASPLALVLVSFERFIGIVYPLHYNGLVTNTRLRVVVLSQWFISVAPEIISFSFTHLSAELDVCYSDSPEIADYILYTTQLFLRFVFPITALVYLYYRMFASLRQYARIGVNASNNQAEKETVRARKNILINLLIITVLFIALLTPCQLVVFFHDISVRGELPEGEAGAPSEPVDIHISLIFNNILVLCNSVVNPLVYALRYKQFKRAAIIAYRDASCKSSS